MCAKIQPNRTTSGVKRANDEKSGQTKKHIFREVLDLLCFQ